MIRVGLVGYGLAGATFHAPLIRSCSRMELSAVLTSRKAPQAVEDLPSLLKRCNLVVVASPNATHFDIAKAALEAGKHVVIDKPFTATLEQADALIALAARAERRLSVFHNRRWDSDFLTVRKIISDLGRIQLYQAYWDRFRPALREGWKEVADGPTGVLLDLGPHLIDQALQLFGMPDSLSCDLAAQRPGSQIDDYFELTLHYGSMRAILGSSALVADPRARFAVHGEGGSFIKHGLDPQEEALKSGADPLSPAFGLDPRDGQLTSADGADRKVVSERGCYLKYYDRIAAAILDDEELPVTALDGRRVMAIVAVAQESARSGRRLTIATPDGSTELRH